MQQCVQTCMQKCHKKTYKNACKMNAKMHFSQKTKRCKPCLKTAPVIKAMVSLGRYALAAKAFLSQEDIALMIGAVLKHGLHFLDSGKMEETTTEDSDGTGGFFRLYDFAFSVTYARRMTDRLNLGISMKYVKESFFNVAVGAQSVALDIGSIFDTGLWGMVLGMSVSNFRQFL